LEEPPVATELGAGDDAGPGIVPKGVGVDAEGGGGFLEGEQTLGCASCY